MPKQPQPVTDTPREGESRRLLRDQERALHAYQCVGGITEKSDQKSYKIAVNDLGASLMRLKLAGAMAALERRNDRGGRLLLEHLGKAKIPGLIERGDETLPDAARRLPVEEYMLATREMMRVAEWLKRAVQATFDGD